MEECNFEIVVLGGLAGFDEDLILGFVLLDHHVDHHFHLIFGGCWGLLVLH